MNNKKNTKGDKITVDKLATMMKNSFESLETKMATKEDIKGVREDILNLGDRFVSYHAFDALSNRVKVLEEKK